MTFRVSSPAKLNLGLSVGLRGGDGFTQLDTVFFALAWHDDIDVHVEPGAARVGLTVLGNDAVPADSSNLVWRAVEAWMQASAQPCQVDIVLHKRIPAGGGLGGGSSNAAAVLGCLNAISSKPLPLHDLMATAASLGSDVPFFLLGGTARGWGRGQWLTPIPVPMTLHVVLVLPGFPVSTPWCFNRHAERARPLDPSRSAALVAALMGGDYSATCAAVHNDLQAVVAEEHAQIDDICKALLSAGCDAALMTGSGSSVFGLAGSEDQARQAADRLPTDLGQVLVTRGASF